MTDVCQNRASAGGAVGAYNGACMAIARDFPYCLPRCTVVDKNFGIGANASEMVSRRRKPHILYKPGVRFNGLRNRP